VTPKRLRVVGLADTDSYLKWGAALLGTLPADVDVELLIVETGKTVSAAQQAAALSHSGLDLACVRRVTYEQVSRLLTENAADAVLVAARGPVVRVLIRAVAALRPRPVIVSGLPGISIPATTAAIVNRMQCDLFVLHSAREVDAFTALARRRGIRQQFGLARLPFAAARVPSDPAPGGSDLVFASQAIVPKERADRMRVARLLVRAALANPDKRVIVKERGVAGEHQTHAARYSYPDLLRELAPLPENLIVSTVPMARALDSAEGLVTVSSTAAIEAVARGIPVIALDSFGVDDKLINPVFVGSGLFGSEEDVVSGQFSLPSREWLVENYFHETSADDWIDRVRTLVALRLSGDLPFKPRRERRGGRVRDLWERKLALGSADRSLAGRAAWTVGVPLRVILRPYFRHRLEKAIRPSGLHVADLRAHPADSSTAEPA
jgi:hypothetical protein